MNNQPEQPARVDLDAEARLAIIDNSRDDRTTVLLAGYAPEVKQVILAELDFSAN
jgi:hypothetical protein